MSPRRRWWSACLVGLGVCALLLWRWQTARETTDKLWAEIRARGVLRVGMDASFPPFEMINGQGEFVGYDVSLARELARRLGLEATFVNIHFDGLYDALLDGKCDVIISALPYDRDLTQDVTYSMSYFNAGQMLVIRADAPAASLRDLQGQRVAVELGSEAHYVVAEQARRWPTLQVMTTYTAAEALDALVQGRAAGAAADAVTAYAFVRDHPETRLATEPLSDEPYVIAMPRGSPHLARAVGQALATLLAEGYLEQLRDEFF